MNLGKWITSKFGTKAHFAAKIGADPTLISRWMGGAGISEAYQAKIRKLGYDGPWPGEEAKEASGGALTREEFAEWRGRWNRGEESVLERLKDLDRRLRELERRAGIHE